VSRATTLDWRKASLNSLILVFGGETYISNEVIRRLKSEARSRFDSVEIQEIEASEYEPGDLLNLVSPSLFADPKLIIVNSVERATDALIQDSKNMDLSQSEEVFLVFQHSGSSTRASALLEQIRATDSAIEVPALKLQYDGEKLAFVNAHFSENKRKISGVAAKALVDAFGSDLAELASSCDQLLADSAEAIDEELVERYFGGRVEAGAFRILDAAFAGNTGEAIMLLRHALQTGADPIYLLSGIASGIRGLAKVYADPRITPASASMNPNALSKAKKNVSGWDDEGIAKALREIALTDAALKGAERDPDYRFEQLLTLVASRGKIS